MSIGYGGGFMKKFIAFILCVTCIFSLSTLGFANSGPVFWKGYPASEIMSVEENSPIIVEGEKLVFDFSEEIDSSHTIGGKVTATYEMYNPTNESQSVQMAFPFVGRLDSLSSDNIIITDDNEVLPYDIYVGDVVDNHGDPRQGEKEVSFDFSSIVNNITNKPYTAKHFAENEKGKLYIIDVKPTTEQRINFSVDFDYDYEKTKILTNGFNRYEYKDKETRIASWCYGPKTLEIFVLGDDIDLNINAFTDGELKVKTDLLTHQISIEEKDVRSYLMEYIKNNTKVGNEGVISDTQLYNLYAKSLDKEFTERRGYSSEDDIIAREYLERIFTIVYTVEFPSNMGKEVSICYIASGTMDRSKTAKPLYTFDYILNPAKNWSDFKNLNIEIIPGQEAPYVVESNIELVRGEKGVYTVALASLPEGDLSFTLYANEDITLLDRIEGGMQNTFGPFSPIVIGVVVILVFVMALQKIRKYKRKKVADN